MAQPPAYIPQTEFLVYQAQQAWFPGQQLDVEFNDIQTSIAAIKTNLVILQNDDGTLGHGLVGFSQLAPAFQAQLLAQGFTGQPSSGPNTWIGLQTFPNGVSAVSLAMGASNSPHSFIDSEPNTQPAGYIFSVPTWNFNEQCTAGFDGGDGNSHIAFAITGTKSVSVAKPNGTGSYIALNVNQFGQGGNANSFILGALLEATAVFNPVGQNAGRFFGGNSQVVVPDTSGGTMSLNEVCAHEFDVFVNQPVAIKEAIRIVDLSSSSGTNTDVSNSAYIRVLKGNTAPGLPYGLKFSSDYSGSYTDAGFPIQNGGAGIFFSAPTKSLYALIDASQMAGGFSIAGVLLPANNPGVWWGAAGGGGKINSGTGVGGPTLTFANGTLNVNKPLVLDAGAATLVDLSFQQNAVEQWQIGTLANGHFYAKDIVNSSAFIWQMTSGGTFAFTPSVSFAGGISGGVAFSGATTFSASPTITVANAMGLLVQSGAIGADAWIALGTNTVRFNIAAIGSAGDFFGGTAQGDAAFQAVGNLHFGASAAGKIVKIYSDAGTLATTIDATQNLTQVGNVTAASYKVGSNQVVTARQTGWTVATGTPQRSTFTTGGVTLAQLAGVVMALEQDLIAHGLIGT